MIDAVGWGDATNAFVEGRRSAPGAFSSIERRPGGPAGNGTDTNDNATDWFVTTTPSPQNLASPSVPGADLDADGHDRAAPEPDTDRQLGRDADAEPDGSTDPEPDRRADPKPDRRADPHAGTDRTPTPVPTPVPTATPDPTATPTPPPSIVAIADARAMPDASTVTIAGVLTTDLGAVESARGGFVQDSTGGIAIYLDAAVTSPMPMGTPVVVRGFIDDRFAQRTLRVGVGHRSGRRRRAAATVGRDHRHGVGSPGRRLVAVSGAITLGPDELSDGTAVTIDDGSGPLRVVVIPAALASRELRTGDVVSPSVRSASVTARGPPAATGCSSPPRRTSSWSSRRRPPRHPRRPRRRPRHPRRPRRRTRRPRRPRP